MKTKILLIEHDPTDMQLIQHALKKGNVNYISEIAQTKSDYEKVLYNFKPDLILSNYTSPSFDGPAAFEIKEKLAPQTPFIFVSKTIDLENAITLIKNGATDIVLKERLETLAGKINRALKDAAQTKKGLIDVKKVMDYSLDVICTSDEEGNFVHISAASESLWGYKPEELIGNNYMDLVFNDDTENTINADAHVKSGVPGTMFENRYIHKNGSIVPLIWSANWDDKDKLMYCIAKNPTKKIKLEKAFEVEKQRFQDLFLQAPSCMGILKGPNHVYELANDLYLQLIDKKKDIIGKTVKEVLPELEAQGVFEFLDTVYKTGETFSANEMLVKLDLHGNGKLVDTYLNSIYQAHRDSEGTIDGIFFFANDVTEQVLSRKKIEESALRYRSLVEQASDAICIIDESMKIIDVNSYACEILGYSRAEIIQLSIGDFFLEEDLKANTLKIDALKEGETIRSEQRIKRKDAIIIDMQLTTKILKDGNMLLFARDITATKKAQLALMESEKKYRQIVETAQEGIWLIDENHKTTFVNGKMCQILEYTQKEMMGKEIYSFMDEEGKQLAAKLMKRKKKLKSGERHFKYISKSGKEIWVNVAVNPFISETGEYKGSMAMVTDITARRKAEESLLQSESRLKEAQAIASLGSWELNFETGIALWSDETCRIYGLSPKDNKQSYSSWISFIHPDDINNVMTIVNESQRTLSNSVLNNRIILKDGTIKYVDSACRFIFDQNGKPVGSFGIAHDVTEIKLAKLQLEQQNKELAFQNEEKENRTTELSITNKKLVKTNIELDRFVYSISHDLRSPLTSILGLISFIEEETRETDTLEHVKMIRKSINRLDEFIKNILSYSRNNRTGLEIAPIPLQETATEIVNSLRNMKEAKGVLFEISIREQQSFYTDRLRLNTILENLISNAIKYHKKEESGRYIKIIGQSDHKKLQLSITDNGIGIEPMYHDKIFDMFFRLSGKKDGSGIGLYIVKDTVEILQGSIQVRSEKGAGTTFIITLKNLKP